MGGAVPGYGLDRARITFLGYSNGASFTDAVGGAASGYYPQRAILIRAMAVLETLPDINLIRTHALMLTETRDPYGENAPALEAWLRVHGADLDARRTAAGHELTPDDAAGTQGWLQGTKNTTMVEPSSTALEIFGEGNKAKG